MIEVTLIEDKFDRLDLRELWLLQVNSFLTNVCLLPVMDKILNKYARKSSLYDQLSQLEPKKANHPPQVNIGNGKWFKVFFGLKSIQYKFQSTLALKIC